MRTPFPDGAQTGTNANSTPESPEGWEHLLAYGFAPGGYLVTCSTCRVVKTGLDKRAINCRPCAERLLAERTGGATPS